MCNSRGFECYEQMFQDDYLNWFFVYFFLQVKTWQCNVKMRNRLYQFNNTKLIKVQHGSPGHQFFSTVWPWFLFGFIFFMCGLWKIEWATLAPQPTITKGGGRSKNLRGQTVIYCLFLSRQNHGVSTAPLAPQPPMPLIIVVRFSALAIPAESAIADKKKKNKENSSLYYRNNSQRLWISLFSKIELKMKKIVKTKCKSTYCSVAKQKRNNEYTCKTQWKMDLVINYSSDIIIDNFSYVYETNYTSSNCTMRWNIFRRSIIGFFMKSSFSRDKYLWNIMKSCENARAWKQDCFS